MSSRGRAFRLNDGETTMQRMLLIYSDEKAWTDSEEEMPCDS
jgi:hypothetical protein